MPFESRREVIKAGGTLGAALAGCVERNIKKTSATQVGSTVVDTLKYDSARTGAWESEPPKEGASKRWAITPKLKTGKPFTATWPLITKSLVVLSLGKWRDPRKGTILAIDKDNGDKTWQRNVNGSVSSVSVGDYGLFAGSKQFLSLSPDRGSVQWAVKPGKPGASAPAIVGNRAYFSGGDGVYALDTEDGSVIWSVKDIPTEIISTPAVSDDIVFTGHLSPSEGALLGLRAADGKEKWRKVFENDGVNKPPAIGDSRVYYVTEDGSIGALDATAGTTVWEQNPEGPTGVTPSSPTISDGQVYVRTEGNLYALESTTGIVEWKTSLNSTRPIPVHAVGDSLVVSNKGSIEVLRPNDGSTKYTIPLPNGGYPRNMAIVDEMAFIAVISPENGDNFFNIYAIG